MEEILRFDALAQYTPRMLTQDVTLHGQTLREGDFALLLTALLDRFSSVQRAHEQDERTHSPMLRGFHHLWLEFS